SVYRIRGWRRWLHSRDLVTELPERLFVNPAWHALQTNHRHFAISAGDACRYPAEVAPFGAVTALTEQAMADLHSMLAPGEAVWLVGEEYPRIRGLVFDGGLE